MVTNATSTWLRLVMLFRSASRATCVPEMAMSRFTLAWLLSALPTPTTSIRLLLVPLILLASSTARSLVGWSLLFVPYLTSGGGPWSPGSPALSRS